MPVALPVSSAIAARSQRRYPISDSTVAVLFALVPVVALAIATALFGAAKVMALVATTSM